MKLNYELDETALGTDPRLNNLNFDPGSHRNAFESEVGQTIFQIAKSRAGAHSLIAVVTAAPSRPPIPALEPFIFNAVGEEGFTDEMKKYTGRAVRKIIEELGGRWVRKGVKTSALTNFCP